MIVGVELHSNQLTFVKHNENSPQQELVDCIAGYIKCFYMKYRRLDCATLDFATNGHVTANERGHIYLDDIEIGIIDMKTGRLTVYIPYEGNVEFIHLIHPLIIEHWNEIESLQDAIIERMKFEFA